MVQTMETIGQATTTLGEGGIRVVEEVRLFFLHTYHGGLHPEQLHKC